MLPSSINRYQIRGRLGAGGMATVYRAYDPQFEREVAVKVLPREHADQQEFLQRFRREARTIAALEHPAIVPVHDFGEADGQPYLVMRLMAGGSLKDRLASRTPLPLAEIARLFSRLAPALDYAHKQGIVHRDLKPGNILFDQHGEPYLADFGIVRLSDSSVTLTHGAPIGTPAYMSPEQGRGAGEIDHRSDIYSLGAMLFEMLTGRVPYMADTPTGQIIQHITEPVPDLQALRPDLPTDLQTVVARAMAKTPHGRYNSVGELAADLHTLAAGGSLPKYTPTLGRIDAPTLPPETGTTTLPGRGAPPPPGVTATPTLTPAPAPRRGILLAAGLLGVVCLLAVGLGLGSWLVSQGQQGLGPLAGLASPTAETAAAATATETGATPGVTDAPQTSSPVDLPTATPSPTLEPSATPEPSFTPTPSTTPTETALPEVLAALYTQVAPLSATPGLPAARFILDAAGVPMALIPGGAYAMGADDGAPDEAPEHVVIVSGFYLDVYEASNAEYARCVEAGACTPPASTANFDAEAYYGAQEFASYPVFNVTWEQSSAYCAWRGARLPTEAEWEKAARGGLISETYPWGNAAPTCERGAFNGANYGPCNNGNTLPVGSFGPNPFGLFDLAGNVWEWVSDWYDEDYYPNSPVENPPGAESGELRVLRGGGWRGNEEFLRVANRSFPNPELLYFGIRCAVEE